MKQETSLIAPINLITKVCKFVLGLRLVKYCRDFKRLGITLCKLFKKAVLEQISILQAILMANVL